ncbi:MAG TPA: SpvB/TcaC N-terminal domain-containing protein, partial [Polyangia bacterium]
MNLRADIKCLVLLVLLAAAGPAAGESSTQVNASSGQFTTAVPIGVPPMFGLEPQISVRYSSTQLNGVVGVGWGLSGFSSIARMSATRGAPAYDATDRYSLDGMELIPGCIKFMPAGGDPAQYYCTKIESFQRIRFDGTTWVVTTRDGVQSRYGAAAASRLTTAAGVSAWYLDRVTDTSGNSVDYSYWTDTGVTCGAVYPSVVAQGPKSVQFYYEGRPDTSYRGNGACLTAIRYRLKTIAVSVTDPTNATKLARAYAFTYDSTGSSPQSVLATVRQYGGDAVVDAGGVVTGGSYVPDMVLTTSLPPESLAADATLGTRSSDPGAAAWKWWADVNGDGRMDFVYMTGTSGSGPLQVQLSTGDTLASNQSWGTRSKTAYIHNSMEYSFWADVDGDGKDDYVYRENNSTNIHVLKSTGTGFVADSVWGAQGSDASALPAARIDYRGQTVSDMVWMADMNRDGKADFVWVDAASNIQVLLSNGAGFGAAQVWGTIPSFLTYFRPCGQNTSPTDTNCRVVSSWLTDVNGDGLPDLVYEYGGDATWSSGYTGPVFFTGGLLNNGAGPTRYGMYVGINTGTGFVHQGFWERTASGSGDRFIDMNGDGYPDLVQFWGNGTSSPFTVHVTLSDGNHLSGKSVMTPYPDPNWGIHWVNPTEYTASPTAGPQDFSGTALGGYVWVVDMNGDGLPDLVYRPTGTKQINVLLGLRGGGFAWEQVWATSTAAPKDTSWKWMMDVKGEGRSMFVYNASGTKTMKKDAPTGVLAPLLTGIANGLGATTTVAYTPSTVWPGASLPAGFIFPTVSSVAITDGRGGRSTATYTYSGSRWGWLAPPSGCAGSDCLWHGEYFGFRKAVTTQDATGGYSETYYWQRQGSIGKPEAIYRRANTGAIMSFDRFVFSENDAPPYTSVATEGWSFECNGLAVITCVDANGANPTAPITDAGGHGQECPTGKTPSYVSGCLRVYVGYGYDVYGNITSECQWGDYDTAGDERSYVRGFVVGDAGFVVRLAFQETYAGLATPACAASGTATLMARQTYYYDDAVATTTPPTRGALTRKSEWLDQTGGTVDTLFQYDAYGNLTWTQDADGRPMTKTYDSYSHTYNTVNTDALGGTTQVAYDYVSSNPLTQTDLNGHSTTFSYDAFGRRTQTANPDGTTTQWTYLALGDPNNQRTRQQFWDPALNAWVWEDDYFDGLGRVYKKVSSNGVIGETLYDGAGRVWKQAVPHLVGETPRYDVNLFDALGRVTAATAAEGGTTTYVYGNRSTRTTNPLLQSKTAWRDAFGRLTQVDETLAGQT